MGREFEEEKIRIALPECGGDKVLYQSVKGIRRYLWMGLTFLLLERPGML